MNIKRFTLIVTLLMSGLLAQALTVNELLSKYKKFPDTQYKEFKGKELKKHIDNELSEAEKEVLRTAKRLVMVLAFFEKEQIENLTSDLNSLEDYSLAISYSMSDAQSDGNMRSLPGMNDNTSVTVSVYSENSSSSEYLLKPVIVINLCEMIGLMYIDGKIKPEETKDLIKVKREITPSVIRR